MLIKIIGTFLKNDILNVSFSSSAGDASAIWTGSTPKAGQHYDVEIEINDLFLWKKNINPSLKTTEGFYASAGEYHLIAELIDIDENNIATIKAANSLITIELEKPLQKKPIHIDLTLTDLELYPTNI